MQPPQLLLSVLLLFVSTAAMLTAAILVLTILGLRFGLGHFRTQMYERWGIEVEDEADEARALAALGRITPAFQPEIKRYHELVANTERTISRLRRFAYACAMLVLASSSTALAVHYLF